MVFKDKNVRDVKKVYPRQDFFKEKSPSAQSSDAGRERRIFVSETWLLIFGCFCLVKAVAAVNRPTLTWLKRYFSLCTTLGTGRRVHLPWGVAISLALFSGLSACWAAFRLICKTFSCIEFLFPSSEGEVGAAIGTLK